MIAALLSSDSGAWYWLVAGPVLVVVSLAGCWFGCPPEVRRGIVREVRREWVIRRWERQQRRRALAVIGEGDQHA